MSAQVGAAPSAAAESRGVMTGIVGFFESLIGLAMIGLVVSGIIALTLTWRTSNVEFLGAGELQVTQSTWWGIREEVKVFQASGVDGWTIKRDNGDRVPLRTQGILLRN